MTGSSDARFRQFAGVSSIVPRLGRVSSAVRSGAAVEQDSAPPLRSRASMFPSGNGSSHCPETNRSVEVGGSGPEAVVVPVVFGLIFAVGVMGNSLVMVVIGKASAGGRTRRRCSPTNVFMVNLSAADLLFLLTCVPLHATIYSLPQWVFGAFLCSFGHYFSTVSMLVSIFTLVAMSVDRYVAVVLAGRSPCARSRRNALSGVCVIWTLSLVCSTPVAQHQVLTGHPSAPNSTFCWEKWSGASKRSYKVLVLLLGYLLPLLLISCCYIRVRPSKTHTHRTREQLIHMGKNTSHEFLSLQIFHFVLTVR